MNQQTILHSAGICSGLLLTTVMGCVSPAKQKTVRPNIIFIMSDDHAVNAVSCYNGNLNQTPNIDRLAMEGMRFNNSFVTNSICAPCRAVILTGKYSHLNGLFDNTVSFDSSQQTFPKLLQKAGYQTAIIGKWHLKTEPTGFDYWNVLPGQGNYYNPDFIKMGERERHEGYVTDIITDFSLDWLKNRDPDKPFFLMVHHKAPHRNWKPDTADLTLYDDIEFEVPGTFFDNYSSRGTAAKTQEMSIAKDMLWGHDMKFITDPDGKTTGFERELQRFNEKQLEAWHSAYDPKNNALKQAGLKGKDLALWKYQRYIKDYLRCIKSVDENVGRILDFLREEDIEKNTIVVYTSDQGFYLGEHGWFDKRFMYEESLRMPLLIKYPEEIKPGAVCDDMVLNLDFAATFLDYAGVPVPDDIQGKSIRSLLKGKSPKDWRKAIYYHYYEYPAVHMVKRHYGIRTDRYKLIHFYYDIDEWELYDLQEDPEEMNNLYSEPGYQEIVKDMKIKLKNLQQQFLEPLEEEQIYL
jgi:arylsulfatase A-like enzyme